MADLVTNTSALRELLRQAVERMQANPDLLVNWARGKAEEINKRGFSVTLDYDRNASIGYPTPQSGAFVTPDSTTFDKLTCNYQYMQTGARVGYESHLQSAGALVSAKAEAMNKIAKAITEWEEFYLCQGDGTQKIATVSAGVASATQTMSGATDGIGAYFLRVGQKVRIYDSTGVTLRGTRTISSKTSNNVVVFDSSVTTTTGDIVVPEGTVAPTSAVKGLPYIYATTGSYFNLNKTTNPNLKPIADTVSAALSATKILYNYKALQLRNGKNPNTIIALPPAQQAYYYTLFKGVSTDISRANYNAASRPQGDLGLASMEYTWFGMPMKEFNNLLPSVFYFLPVDKLCKAELKGRGAVDLPAGDWIQAVDSSGAGYIMAVDKYHDNAIEYFTAAPHQFGGLTNLTWSGLPVLANDSYIG
jgi:hypothetical protein